MWWRPVNLAQLPGRCRRTRPQRRPAPDGHGGEGRGCTGACAMCSWSAGFLWLAFLSRTLRSWRRVLCAAGGAGAHCVGVNTPEFGWSVGAAGLRLCTPGLLGLRAGADLRLTSVRNWKGFWVMVGVSACAGTVPQGAFPELHLRGSGHIGVGVRVGDETTLLGSQQRNSISIQTI